MKIKSSTHGSAIIASFTMLVSSGDTKPLSSRFAIVADYKVRHNIKNLHWETVAGKTAIKTHKAILGEMLRQEIAELQNGDIKENVI